jgi:hypothetical protein
MYTVWAGGVHLNCLSLGYRFKVIYCDDGQEVNRKDLCKLYVWWLGNSKDKAVYLLVVSNGTLFLLSALQLTGRLYSVERTVWIVMLCNCQRSILCSKSVVGILPSISENTKLQFQFHRHRICTHFIWKCVSECLNKRLYL